MISSRTWSSLAVSLRRVHNPWQPSAVKGLLMMAEKSDKEDFSVKINKWSISSSSLMDSVDNNGSGWWRAGPLNNILEVKSGDVFFVINHIIMDRVSDDIVVSIK